jgi:RNA polymerase sigma-70 factor (ECF subfamily)
VPVNEGSSAPEGSTRQDLLYEEVMQEYAAAVERLARAYELNAEDRRDLVQEIHFAIWQSLSKFDERCSLRTWVYRVAHNTAASHVMRQHRTNTGLVSLDETPPLAGQADNEAALDGRQKLDRLLRFIQQLNPLDRQLMVLYLEDLDAAAIAEITGISPGNVATRIHRIKNFLSRRFGAGGRHA